MTHPTMPKRFDIQIMGGVQAEFYSENGSCVDAEQALAYANALAKQARLDALEEAVEAIENEVCSIGVKFEDYPISYYNTLIEQQDLLTSMAAAIRKLKETV